MEQISTLGFWSLFALLFAAVVLRYYLLAGLFHILFSPIKDTWKSVYIYRNHPTRKQYVYEMGWSLITSVIFAFLAAGLLQLWADGWLPIYTEITSKDWWYMPLSIVFILFFHETMYYWMHRWMHLPRVFKYVHKVHHQSLATSSWTAFSFHPLEGFIQMAMLAIIVVLVPMHYFVLLGLLIFMTLSSIINHLGVDIYPKKGRFRKYFIGAKHHGMHHEEFTTNYGLYFTFWDRWMKTESTNFE